MMNTASSPTQSHAAETSTPAQQQADHPLAYEKPEQAQSQQGEEEEEAEEEEQEEEEDDEEENKIEALQQINAQVTNLMPVVTAPPPPKLTPAQAPVTYVAPASAHILPHALPQYRFHHPHYSYPYQHHQHHPYQYYHHHQYVHPPLPLHGPPHPPPLPPHHHQQQPQQHHPYHVYPPPMATHKDLLDSRDLFYSTLTKFHVALGTKLTIPKIGGKDLDLHLLYKEVTDRGGLERVINERKWKEITVVLDFPRTTTSASFVLRKYYINLLHHYEQVHFFRVQGLLVPPPAPPPTSPSPMPHSAPADFNHPASEGSEKDARKRKMDSAQALGVDPASSIGTIVTGSIDAKIDYAYLVTVMVGTRKMRGVLYHVPPSGSIPQGATVSPLANIMDPEMRTTLIDRRMGSRQRRRQISRKDPNAPRQNRTGYNFFFAEQRAKLKSVQPDKDRAISKMIGDLWNRLSEDEKSPYQERGLEDKERYRREMREYKERLRIGVQGAVAIRHPNTPQGASKCDSDSNIVAPSASVHEIPRSLPDTKPLPEGKEPVQSRSDPPTEMGSCNSCTSLFVKQNCYSESRSVIDERAFEHIQHSSDTNTVGMDTGIDN